VIIHGLWSAGTGLLLWLESVEAVDAKGLYPYAETTPRYDPGKGSLAKLLAPKALRGLRRRIEVQLPDDGELRSWTLPATALAPRAAAPLLLAIAKHSGAVGDLIIGADLRYLAETAADVAAWVDAGRAAPALTNIEGNHWARWTLADSSALQQWREQRIAGLAPVLRALPGASSGAALVDDLTAELTDAIMRERTVDVAVPEHPFVAALLTGDEVDLPARQYAALEQGLQRWADSGTRTSSAVVLRLLEPHEEPAWCLQVCLRREGGAPIPVAELPRSASTTREAIEGLGHALSAYPPLRTAPAADAAFTLALSAQEAVGLVGIGAPALAEAGIALLLPRAWTKAEPSLKLRVDTPEPSDTPGRLGLDALVNYQWRLSLGDVELTEQEMSALAQANAPLVQLRGEWVQVDGPVLARAARYVAKHSQTDGTLAGMLTVLTGADPPEVPVAEVQASGWWEQVLGGTHRQLSTVGPPSGLHAELRPYQQRGLDWLAFMSSIGLGVVLADDMGLGKTIQLLSLLLHENAVRPTLLVCPMSVVGNWEREAATFAPELRVLVHHGVDRRKGQDVIDAAAAHDLVLTTYAVMSRDTDLRGVAWERVALDEAQHIKNSSTAQARAARALPARHRVALTGTPVENRLEELRSILDFANPGMLGSAQGFRTRFAKPIERDRDPAAVSRLRAATGPFVLRRLKTDAAVITDLPAKFEMTVRANLTAEQAGLYQAVVEEMLAKIEAAAGIERKALVLTTLTRLKQVCNHPAHFLADGSAVLRRGQHRSGKLGLVEDVLDSVLGDGEKALLFTQFRQFGDLVTPWFAERFGVEVPFLHGGVSKRGRDAMVADFQGTDGAPVMVLSLKAGGTGLNLTAANHVVHLDRWWNPAVENQATDRAFRIGQRRDVQVRKLVCVGTVEEKIDALIAGKQELADLAVGTGEGWVTELGTEALRELLTLGAEAVGE